MTEQYFEYDICLSFAGEQREYVEQVAGELTSRGFRVFFDDYERVALWGKDLYTYLSDIYENQSRFCIIFASKEYAKKVWTNRERESAQARALKENQEYILPVRFDDTPIPGLLDTIAYIDATQTSPTQLSNAINEKVGRLERREYLPANLDRLFERLGIDDDQESQVHVQDHASAFLQVLRRMTEQERKVVIRLIYYRCSAEMSDYVHISADLLCRVSGESIATIKRLLGGIRSLGFECSLADETEDHWDTPGVSLGTDYTFYLRWFNLGGDDWFPALAVAAEMISGATDNYCEEHGMRFLERLDFSQLASATVSKESDET